MKRKLIDTVFDIGRQCLLQRKGISVKADISQVDFVVIDLLDSDGKLSCNDLSKRMGLSVSRSSRIVDRLLHKGYVLRKTNPQNRRAVQIYLSQKGKKLKKNIEKLKGECEKKIFGGIDAKEIEIVERGIVILQQSLRQYS